MGGMSLTGCSLRGWHMHDVETLVYMAWCLLNWQICKCDIHGWHLPSDQRLVKTGVFTALLFHRFYDDVTPLVFVNQSQEILIEAEFVNPPQPTPPLMIVFFVLLVPCFLLSCGKA